MLKADSVNAGMAAIQAGVSGALGQCFDDGAASVAPVQMPGLSQADVDKAVADATAALHSQVDSLTAQVGDETAKLAASDALKAAIAAKLQELQSILAPVVA